MGFVKEYYSNGLFILNVLNVIINKSASTSTYVVDSLDLWYTRFSHVNFMYIKIMKRFGLLSDFSNSEVGKRDECVEAKSTKKTYKIC